MSAVKFSIPSSLLGAWAIAGGCQPAEPMEHATPERPIPEQFGVQEHELGGVAAKPAQAMPVKEGSAPLVYLAETAQTIRVHDATENRVLAETAVSPRTIVRVDERNGVVAGSEQLVAGPLPSGRKYVILIVPDPVNVSRSGTVQPLPKSGRGRE